MNFDEKEDTQRTHQNKKEKMHPTEPSGGNVFGYLKGNNSGHLH